MAHSIQLSKMKLLRRVLASKGRISLSGGHCSNIMNQNIGLKQTKTLTSTKPTFGWALSQASMAGRLCKKRISSGASGFWALWSGV